MKFIKDYRVAITFTVLMVILLTVSSFLLYSQARKGDTRKVGANELQEYIDYLDDGDAGIEVREDGTYSLTKDQFDKALLGKAKKEYDNFDDKEALLSAVEANLESQKTSEKYEQALITPENQVRATSLHLTTPSPSQVRK